MNASRSKGDAMDTRALERQRRPTLRQIAALASVDTSTVSRAINNSPLITKRTKDMVLAIAERLKYMPAGNRCACGGVESRTLGVVLATIRCLQDPFFGQVLAAIERVAADNGYRLLIATGEARQQDGRFPFDLECRRRIEGALLMADDPLAINLAGIRDRGVPFAFVNRRVTRTDCPCVASDPTHASRLAAEHLISLGHRRIGLVAGDPVPGSANECVEGYKAALAAAGLPSPATLVRKGPLGQGLMTGSMAGDYLLSMPIPPTAVVACSEDVAMGVIQSAQRRGIRMPGELEVVCIEDGSRSGQGSPPVTTVAPDPDAIGSAACQLLIDGLSGRAIDPGPRLIPARLVARRNSGTAMPWGFGGEGGIDGGM